MPADRKEPEATAQTDTSPDEEPEQTPSVIHVTPKTEQAEDEPEEEVETEQPKSLREGIYNILKMGIAFSGKKVSIKAK